MSFRVPVGVTDIGLGHRKAVLEVLESGQLSPGAKVREFEKRFSEVQGGKFAVMVNSGTDALRVGLAAMKEKYGWPDGSCIAVPAITFVATVNIVLQNNLTPQFVDIELNNFGIDRNKLWDVRGAVCVIPVHMFGAPVPSRGATYPFNIKSAAHQLGMKILEDSCECMGVSEVFGDVAAYSTYVCHIISTGVGGISVTKDEELADLMRSYANHGRSIDHIPGHRTSRDITKRFVFDRVGYSSRATEFEAALGLEELKHLPVYLKKRKEIAQKLFDGLDKFNRDIRVDEPVAAEPRSWMMYPVVVHKWSTIKKWDLCKFLEKNGIETREMMPLINQPCYKKLNLNPADFPNASLINQNGFYIGIHHKMTDSDVAHVVETFRRFFKS